MKVKVRAVSSGVLATMIVAGLIVLGSRMRGDFEGAEPLGHRYAGQRELYALALASGSDGAGASEVRAIHVFLEAPDDPVSEAFDAQRLTSAREDLEQVIGRIRAGEFVPTASPSHSVCFGCPAAERLCPHPKWKSSW